MSRSGHGLPRSSRVNYEEVLNTAATMALKDSTTIQPKSRNPETQSSMGSHSARNQYQNNDMMNESIHSYSSYDELHSMSRDDMDLLASLPQRPIANFPSEDDRKRIIGCLATILSMMFDHEKDGLLNYSPVSNKNQNASDVIYLEAATEADNYIASGDDEVIDPDLFMENDSFDMNDMSASTHSSNNGRSSNNNNEGNSNNNNKRWGRRKQEVKKNDTKHEKPVKISSIQQRYRRRRHEIYSSFLVFSAELLFLDKSNAMAFLPLLNTLLGENQSDSFYGDDGERSNDHNEQHKAVLGDVSDWKRRQDYLEQTWDDNEILLPFIESLSPGAGFQCISLLLLNYLMKSEVGYDARIRHALKKLCLVLITHEIKRNGDDEIKNLKQMPSDDLLAKLATRKFEALEDEVAIQLLKISAAQQQQNSAGSRTSAKNDDSASKRGKINREKLIRGLKVGSMGLAAGTVFAITGGLAAPGIAAGLAGTSLTATVASTALVTTLTSTAAVTTIFGVGGGSLAAYKVHRRTKGLTEFIFNKEGRGRKSSKDKEIEGNLFTTICISGWLTDDKDFQRPWGVEPSNPPITDWSEKLIRFYTVYNPENLSRCEEILRQWKGEERQLWYVIRQKYGFDPDHLYPIKNALQRSPLSHEENEIINKMLEELGFELPREEKEEDSSSFERPGVLQILQTHTSPKNIDANIPLSHVPSTSNPDNNSVDISSSTQNDSYSADDKVNPSSLQDLKKRAFVWDFQGEYGGELLTVRWESDLLLELCDSVTDLAVDLVGTAAKEILKQTALSVLITAIAWPYGLVKAANMIDGTWTLAIERADLAGIELARSLLESQAGSRPVVLVGFSMGARCIYSCLKELARHQEKWEEQMRTNQKKQKKSRRRQSNSDIIIEYTREPASIVEDAILMGLPNHRSLQSWECCRCVVAGRLVNCYSNRDLILSLMFQMKRLSGVLKPVCGTSPVNVHGVENYDVSNFISSHSDYCKMSGHILRMIKHGCPYRPSAKITISSEFGVDDEMGKKNDD